MRRRTSMVVTLLASGLVLAAACTTELDPPTPLPVAPAPADDGAGPGSEDDDRADDVASEAPGLPPADRDLPRLSLEEVVTLEAPIDTTVLEDGTVLVAERAGRVRVLDGPTPGRIVLDVSGRTTTDGERGLLSIAVAPWGDELFVSMTDADGDTLVEAHPLDGTEVSGPPRTIYATRQPFANHNGGPIVFLPDGTLLLGLGDGGGGGDPLGAGQDLSTPLGSIVRLDVRDGGVAVPRDNPFVGRPESAAEIAASGLRNPWRMAFDRHRGELWIADVGQSEREEINRVTPTQLLGANFGWALREGNAPFLGDEPNDHVPPLHDYEHGPGCSITGGLVYRGDAIPELRGGYVFTDLCDGELRVLMQDGADVTARELGVTATRVIGFGTDADGELLVLEIGGRVLRLVRD